mmetsp:Transcript_11872/g.21423  ORF Transcript_11872/g.21423 Transcript_11872/m.21423 type:complete len:219 (-) Transcript_11872:147-803(-)
MNMNEKYACIFLNTCIMEKEFLGGEKERNSHYRKWHIQPQRQIDDWLGRLIGMQPAYERTIPHGVPYFAIARGKVCAIPIQRMRYHSKCGGSRIIIIFATTTIVILLLPSYITIIPSSLLSVIVTPRIGIDERRTHAHLHQRAADRSVSPRDVQYSRAAIEEFFAVRVDDPTCEYHVPFGFKMDGGFIAIIIIVIIIIVVIITVYFSVFVVFVTLVCR